MPEPLKPIASIPVPLNKDGSVFSPALNFAPDSSVLYLRQPVEPFNLGEYIQWHAPDVAGIMLLLALLLHAITQRRVFRTPRRRGSLYCRTCNYQITPPLARRKNATRIEVAQGARCPECGRALSGRGIVGGRRAWVRLWPVWVLALPVAMVCVGTMALTLQWYTPPRGVPWPLADVRRVLGGWTLQKIPRDAWHPTTDRITRWRLPGVTRMEGEWSADTLGYNNAMLTADGSNYIFIVDEHHGSWTPRLLVFDTRTGVRREVGIPVKPGSGTELLGLSTDGKRAFVQCPNNVGSISDGFAGCCLRLMEVDLETLEFGQIASFTIQPVKSGSGYGWPFARFIVDDSTGTLRWAMTLGRTNAANGATQCDVTWFDGTARHEYVVPGTGKGWAMPQLLDHGSALQVAVYAGTTCTRLDLATGAMTPSTPSAASGRWGRSENGRFALDRGTNVNSVLDVLDTSSGRTVAQIATPAGLSLGGGMISNDGRFVACCHCTAPTPPFDYVIGIWDLGSGANGAPRPQPGEPAPTP